VFACAPIAELRFIMAKDRTTKTAPLIKPKGGLAPQASPIISEPKFGRRNSDLETVANNFILSNMMVPTPRKGGFNQKKYFQRLDYNYLLYAFINDS
jgi:hypothetical protein